MSIMTTITALPADPKREKRLQSIKKCWQLICWQFVKKHVKFILNWVFIFAILGVVWWLGVRPMVSDMDTMAGSVQEMSRDVSEMGNTMRRMETDISFMHLSMAYMHKIMVEGMSDMRAIKETIGQFHITVQNAWGEMQKSVESMSENVDRMS